MACTSCGPFPFSVQDGKHKETIKLSEEQSSVRLLSMGKISNRRDDGRSSQENTQYMLAAVGWANERLDAFDLGQGPLSELRNACIVYHSGAAHIISFSGEVMFSQEGSPRAACVALIRVIKQSLRLLGE